MKPLVGVIMGSRSDWSTMTHATETLTELGIPFETRVVSAHRTPDLLFEYAGSAVGRGLEVLIAGAGGAAHLPGMTAAKTRLPVIGVPVRSRALQGIEGQQCALEARGADLDRAGRAAQAAPARARASGRSGGNLLFLMTC